MNRRHGSVIGIWAAAMAALALLSMTACSQEVVEAEPVVRPVKMVTLGESAASSARIFPGTLRASERAKLSFRVSGPLVQLPAREGLRVRKGQLLAQIDRRDFETRVQNLEAQLASLRAERKAMEQARPEDIQRAEANLEAARARLLEAQASFRRYQRLYENDNVSKAEFDQRRAAREVAEADVRTAEQSLRITTSGARVEDVEAMDARIRSLGAQLKMAQDDLRDTSLQAPYAGIVAERYVDNFEFVQAQTPVVSLQNIEIMELVAQIPETVIARSKGEQSVHRSDFYVTFPSLPDQRLKATVSEVSTEADPVTRTYSVTFRMAQPERGNILAGMTGEVHLPDDATGGVGFSVPASAVFADESGASCVWKVEKPSMTVQKQKVEVGELAGESIMLLAGVNHGETVITAGAGFLEEGQKVREIATELRERR